MNARFRLTICFALVLAITFTMGTSSAIAVTTCDSTFVQQQANVFTVLPTGTDDTVNLQCAFDAAVAAGPGAEVRLVEGEYHTAQINVNDFQGQFSGAGASNTVIYNLPQLPVASDCFVNPPSAANPWPSLFNFSGGYYAISRLAIHIVGDDPVQMWSYGLDIYEMLAAINILGTEAHVEINQVLIAGEVKESGVLGYNLLNGVTFTGFMAWLGNPPISGSYSLTDSTFRTLAWASPVSYLDNATVLISHNNYENVFVATDLSDLMYSTIEYSHNQINGALIGLWSYNLNPQDDIGSTFLVKNNQIRTDLYGVVFEQTFGEGNQCLIQGNNVQQVGDIGIYLGPGIHGCTVVGGSNRANVLDEGTDNVLVGVNNMGTGVGPTIQPFMKLRRIASNPSPRIAPAMAYDSESDKVILFGGQTGIKWLTEMDGETWAFDVAAKTWTAMKPHDGPKKSEAASMAYDIESDRVLMYGGLHLGHTTVGEMWAYDYNTNTWQQMTSGPEDHLGGYIAYDSESDRVILFGGLSLISWNIFNDTWAYDFNTDTWTEMKLSASPPARNAHGMAYDAESDRVIIFGSAIPPDPYVWAYDYNTDTWEQMPASSEMPGTLDWVSMTYDSQADRIILYGGVSGSGEFQDKTWAYDYNTNTWTEMKPGTNPGPLMSHVMTYSSVAKLVILFGGIDDFTFIGISDKTWTYDFTANSWSEVTPP